ncbi:hypothetical protein ECZU17_30790 [Escherichia coli]|nr:hypothetical protein ECZU17_30790 [Escherichia coli]
MTVKSAVVLVMLWVSLRNNFAAFLGLQALPFKLAMNDGLSLYASVMRNFVILFIFFALLDVPLAKALFTKGLKMTKQELKEEYKNQEGKPEVKARVRRLQRQLAMGQIRKVVPKANVVITNPTHYAVALQYDQSRAAAPFVVAKGTDEIALYIRRSLLKVRWKWSSSAAGALGLLHHSGESANSFSALPGYRPRSDLRPANETLARWCTAAPGPEQTYFHSQRGA